MTIIYNEEERAALAAPLVKSASHGSKIAQLMLRAPTLVAPL